MSSSFVPDYANFEMAASGEECGDFDQGVDATLGERILDPSSDMDKNGL